MILKLSRLQGFLVPAAIIVIPVLLYFLILSATISSELTGTFRSIEPWTAIVLFILLYIVFKRSGWIGELWSLSITVILFAMSLSFVWNTGFLDGNVIGGLLPWSDAGGYFMDAQRLLVGEKFSAFASRRPLFAGLLSLLLALTSHNLQLCLAFLGLITAFSCHLLAREIRRTEGPLVGVIVLLVVFLYYRVYIHKVLTEHLGLTFGALGLAFIWQGAHGQKKWALLGGIFLLALALNARAGALFILPALVIWGTWFYRGGGWFSKWFLAGSTLAIISAFLLNSLLLRIIGAPQGMLFSNFSHVLYGLASGYKGWSLAPAKFPSATEQEIYQYTLELIRSNPGGLLNGIGLAFKDFLNPKGNNAFVFMYFWGESKTYIYAILYLFSGIGLIWSFLNFLNWRGSLLVAMTFGILASIPFVPPADSEAMRTYAATIPVVGLLLGTGVIAPLRWLRRQETEPSIPEDRLRFLYAPFAASLVAVCILAPILVYQTGKSPQAVRPNSTCRPGFEPLTVYVNPVSLVNLVKDFEIAQTRVPNVRLGDFRQSLTRSGYIHLATELVNLTRGKTILASLDYRDSPNTERENVFLIANSDQIPSRSGLASFCVKPTDNDWLQNYQFYYTQESLDSQRVSFIPRGVSSKRIFVTSLLVAILIAAIILESLINLLKGPLSKLKSKK